MIGHVLARLDSHDRALLCRMCATDRRAAEVRVWRGLTHVGGSIATVLACLLPLLGGHRVGAYVTGVVIISHLLVQLVKRTVGRPRPALGAGVSARAVEPDRFSFPSGHAAAAMAVALGYGSAWPSLQPVLVGVAVLVGVSRAVLGVHYVGDVIVGQLLAVVTAVALR